MGAGHELKPGEGARKGIHRAAQGASSRNGSHDKDFSAQSQRLTCHVYCLLGLHQIQGQGLQVPEVLLQHWVLEAVASVKAIMRVNVNRF